MTVNLVRFAAVLSSIVMTSQGIAAQVAVGGDARVNPDDFEITVFADGLNFPVGMELLNDGSILVAVNKGSRFFGSRNGQLIRLLDADGDGVSEAQQVLADDVPGGAPTALRRAGDLLLVTGQGSVKPIVIYRLGAAPADELTQVGTIDLNYSSTWRHPHSALGVRPTPGQPGSYDLVFQLGSVSNFERTTATGTLTSTIGLSGDLNPDAIHMLTITDSGTEVTGSNLIQLATGVRNPAGFAFHPETGDLYFEDNGIDGLVNVDEPTSADELNVIPFDQIGGEVEDFGFPDSYTEYRTGDFIGRQGVPPLIVYLPIPELQNGAESEGPNDIAFAPPGFPPGLNDGVFVSFHGKFARAGPSNEENPLVYTDLTTGDYFHFVSNQLPGIGHLDGLLATEDKLYVSDISSQGGFGSSGSSTGIIYLIRSKVRPTAVEEVATDAVPANFSLSEAWPNPFNPQTTIRFAIPDRGRDLVTSLKVYDVSGQRIATLLEGAVGAGVFEARWDGKDAQGRRVASGVYFFRFAVGDVFAGSKRMTLLK